MAIKAGNMIVRSKEEPKQQEPLPHDHLPFKVGKFIVKNKVVNEEPPKPVVEMQEKVKVVKKEQPLIGRFYKESPYMKDMINN